MKKKHENESVGSTLLALAESWAEFLGRRYSVRYYGALPNGRNDEEQGSPQAYRISLSSTWGSNQSRQINQLFGSYGY